VVNRRGVDKHLRRYLLFFILQAAPLWHLNGNLLGVTSPLPTLVTLNAYKMNSNSPTKNWKWHELQSTNEELETTNEELQSSNEELQTTNEELQSTNEELETMNEELQSANEELQTINEEVRLRSQEKVYQRLLESVFTSLPSSGNFGSRPTRPNLEPQG